METVTGNMNILFKMLEMSEALNLELADEPGGSWLDWEVTASFIFQYFTDLLTAEKFRQTEASLLVNANVVVFCLLESFVAPSSTFKVITVTVGLL